MTMMMTTTTDHDAPWQRVEAAALLGARLDPRPDKSDWVRCWALCRSYRGAQATAEDWATAYREARTFSSLMTPEGR